VTCDLLLTPHFTHFPKDNRTSKTEITIVCGVVYAATRSCSAARLMQTGGVRCAIFLHIFLEKKFVVIDLRATQIAGERSIDGSWVDESVCCCFSGTKLLPARKCLVFSGLHFVCIFDPTS
jgi:hypothetical protein